ncbi:MAG: ATP-binding protein [Candidatus Marinimicrobia bacterium]|nr:ATP-binding protein [Candidatus Neomarinimicrobiota bacterium]
MYIKRDLEEKITKYMDRDEIIAIVGTRQCGKTTMVNHIMQNYDKVCSLTFEDVDKKLLFEEDINSFIELYVKDYDYLFIDEVQYVKNSGKQLKYIYDTEDIKIIITGSSSTDLSIESFKYLVGRVLVFELFPFSFGEFLSHRDKQLYRLYAKKTFKDRINAKLLKYIKEYIQFGGYPRVVTSDSIEEKKLILKNIYNTYLLREIKEILQLSNNDKLIKLLKALALQAGNLIRYNELSNITGLKFKKLKKYLHILEATYICQRCYPFFSNKRKELVKMPKIYFIDQGFMNQCASDFRINQAQIGAYYENLVFSEFRKKDIELKYWRTKSKAEVDFIKDDKIPIEVKKTPKVTRSFLSYVKKYQPEQGYIVSEIEQESAERKGCQINFVPFSKFI